MLSYFYKLDDMSVDLGLLRTPLEAWSRDMVRTWAVQDNALHGMVDFLQAGLLPYFPSMSFQAV